jgi:hypothetical protein
VQLQLTAKMPRQDEVDRRFAEQEQQRQADPLYDQKLKEMEMRRNINLFVKYQKEKFANDP